MPSRSQYGGAISESFAQQAAHSRRHRRPARGRTGRAAAALLGATRSAARMPERAVRTLSCCGQVRCNCIRCRKLDHLRPQLCARGGARARWARDLPDRPSRSNWASGWRRCCARSTRGRSRHADRRGAPGARAAARSHRSLPPRPTTRRHADVAADEEALPFAEARSIWSSRRWRCNSSTICPARWSRVRRALKPDGLLLAALVRRRQAERTARGLRRKPRAKSKAASRRASRRSPTCANSARCCSAPASRCR